MSVGCDIDCDFQWIGEAYHRSRKPRVCEESGRKIEVGEYYAVNKWIYDGYFTAFIQCLPAYHYCRAVNNLYGDCAVPFDGMRALEMDDLFMAPEPVAEDHKPHLARIGYWFGLWYRGYYDGDTEFDWAFNDPTPDDWDALYSDSFEYAPRKCAPKWDSIPAKVTL